MGPEAAAVEVASACKDLGHPGTVSDVLHILAQFIFMTSSHGQELRSRGNLLKDVLLLKTGLSDAHIPGPAWTGPKCSV